MYSTVKRTKRLKKFKNFVGDPEDPYLQNIPLHLLASDNSFEATFNRWNSNPTCAKPAYVNDLNFENDLFQVIHFLKYFLSNFLSISCQFCLNVK